MEWNATVIHICEKFDSRFDCLFYAANKATTSLKWDSALFIKKRCVLCTDSFMISTKKSQEIPQNEVLGKSWPVLLFEY